VWNAEVYIRKEGKESGCKKKLRSCFLFLFSEKGKGREGKGREGQDRTGQDRTGQEMGRKWEGNGKEMVGGLVLL
jgi:hypothetical protein